MKWSFKRIVLHTDSKTVFGWLSNSVDNISRLKIKGLSEVLVQRRVQIIEDIVNPCGLDVDMKWVPTADNLADGLTRVLTAWLSSQASPAKVAASVTGAAPSLALEDTHCAQEKDETVQKAKKHLLRGEDLPKDHCLYGIKNQLCVVENVVCRSIKFVPNDVTKAPVIP